MNDQRRAIDLEVTGRATVEKVAADLGLKKKGSHFYCPGCQPDGHGSPELVIKEGNFQCFRCGAMGDVVGLVKLARGFDLETAVAWLEKETHESSQSP
jgi:hypothetical protein